MAYIDDITALNPQHLWEFDAAYTDSVGTADGANAGMANADAICEDAANSVESNSTGDRIAIPAQTDIEGAATSKALGGWLRVNSIQLPPKSIYREGTTGNQYNIIMWAGNKLMLDIVSGTTVLQAFSNNVLKPNRIYHVFTKFIGNGEFALYIDGIKQSITVPTDAQTGVANIPARTAAEFADPSGSTEAGNATVLLNAPTNGRYNYWATFFGASATALTDSLIRTELFEKGALPSVVVSNQADLDALANTVRPDEPLNIRVDDNGGDLTLVADNITHDPLASINIQWMGAGTLTYINTNGSDASIISTPNGGTINLITPATLTAAPLIPNTEVRIYESGTITELAGIESSGASFSASIQAPFVDIVIHKQDYVYIRVDGIDMTQGNVALPVNQQFDRNYNGD
jgi:hypothetical protein